MNDNKFEIRVCRNCGLRYPRKSVDQTGVRCPTCLGETDCRGNYTLTGDRDHGLQRDGFPRLRVLLDNIRSGWNVGSILRTAEGFGFRHAYLCGITPTPSEKAVQKTELGSAEIIQWSHHRDATQVAWNLKKNGWRMWGLEIVDTAIELQRSGLKLMNQIHPATGAILVLGSEATGIDPELMAMCDTTISIPLIGKKRSLNVSVAFGIAAFELVRSSMK